jgi:hypothetical protein
MKTVTLQSEIGNDGKLRLEVPVNLPPGPVSVVIHVEPQAGTASASPHDTLTGIWSAFVPAGFDAEAALLEIDENVRKETECLP